MKHFFKVFLIALLCFALAAGAGVFTYYKFYDADAEGNEVVEGEDEEDNENDEEEVDEDEIKDPLQKAIANSGRVNFLLLGMEGTRSDTMIFASFDKDSKDIDMISIPRDTYYLMPEYTKNAEFRKINAVYGKKGVEGILDAVEEILGGVPIDHYVMVDYKGVEEIVNKLGGVEVDVPFHMEYFDPTDKPPLRIDIPKGKQVLKGEQAVKYLRWRHNNDMTVGYPDGDLGRIKAQQKFIISAIKKSISLKLPSVVKACFTHVKTDIGLKDALSLAANSMGLEMEKLSMTTLPGIDDYKTINGTRLSFYNHNPEKVRELMMDIYNVEEENTEKSNEN